MVEPFSKIIRTQHFNCNYIRCWDHLIHRVKEWKKLVKDAFAQIMLRPLHQRS